MWCGVYLVMALLESSAFFVFASLEIGFFIHFRSFSFLVGSLLQFSFSVFRIINLEYESLRFLVLVQRTHSQILQWNQTTGAFRVLKGFNSLIVQKASNRR